MLVPRWWCKAQDGYSTYTKIQNIGAKKEEIHKKNKQLCTFHCKSRKYRRIIKTETWLLGTDL